MVSAGGLSEKVVHVEYAYFGKSWAILPNFAQLQSMYNVYYREGQTLKTGIRPPCIMRLSTLAASTNMVLISVL